MFGGNKMKIIKTTYILLLLLGLNEMASVALQSSPAQSSVVSCEDGKRKLLCLPSEYSKFDLPHRNDFNEIEIGLEISDVLKIDDKDYSITFSLYFNVQWSEPRLNLSREFMDSENLTSEEDQLVPVNLELIHDLWMPNIFIYNLKTFRVIDVLSKLAGLWINMKHKKIYYSQATHITFICPMLFDSFPLDTQVCKFQVGSYSYDMTKMLFRVNKLTHNYYEQMNKQSIILDYSIAIRTLREKDKIFLAGALGNYSLAGFEMNLQRHVMSYIITYYLPSGLFVVVSWISFLIPPDIVPGRMALLITLFLVLINIFNNITTNSPKAEGLTAIEIWMLACILFVFGALIEYAVILFKKQKLSKFGAPGSGSVSYPHSANAMSNYMSIRRPPNKEDTQSGVRAAQIRQRRQEQQTQYDMNPITSCRYNWNQEADNLGSMDINDLYRPEEELSPLPHPLPQNLMHHHPSCYQNFACMSPNGHQYNHSIHLPQTSVICHENHGIVSGQDPNLLHSTLRSPHTTCCCSSCTAVTNAARSLEKHNYVMLPPEGSMTNPNCHPKQQLDDRETRQSVLVQKSGRAENVVIMQKEADLSRHVQKPKDMQHNSVTTFKQENLDNEDIEEYTENKRVLESTCNNVAINSTSKMAAQQQQENDFSDVLSSTNFKDDDKRKNFTPKQTNYEKYHLPSYKEQYLIACKKSTLGSKAPTTTQNILSTMEMSCELGQNKNSKSAKTTFMTMSDTHDKGCEIMVPTGLKSLSNSAPNSPFMPSKMIHHQNDHTVNRTAVVQPNSSSITMAQKMAPNQAGTSSLATNNSNVLTSFNQTSEINTTNTCLLPMTSSSKEEHELQAHELPDRVARYASNGNDQSKTFRGNNQRTSGMAVSVVYKIAEDTESPNGDRAELLMQQGNQQQLCMPNSSSMCSYQRNVSTGQNHLDRTVVMSTNEQELRNRKRPSHDMQSDGRNNNNQTITNNNTTINGQGNDMSGNTNTARKSTDGSGHSSKRKGSKKANIAVYSTWSDKYANIDRFFLWASPFLFLLFNVIYWFYFYVYDLLKRRFTNENDPDTMSQQILINDDRDM